MDEKDEKVVILKITSCCDLVILYEAYRAIYTKKQMTIKL